MLQNMNLKSTRYAQWCCALCNLHIKLNKVEYYEKDEISYIIILSDLYNVSNKHLAKMGTLNWDSRILELSDAKLL